MEETGTIQSIEGPRAKVTLASAGAPEVWASNPSGAKAGDRVILAFAESKTTNRSLRVMLASVILAGALGRILAGISALIEPVQRALGSGLGPFLITPDNLIFGSGLLGLAFSALWLRRGRRPRLPDPTVVQILESPGEKP
ncbi:MAG: hypothetical protein A2V67_18655 [Deltaproteobacteria bacterium RBG_13_61_14]|nr:MAG: hypothetical protein A2V67_18655 [Deltaproteobacteria bacterium RBG_13_61_14]